LRSCAEHPALKLQLSQLSSLSRSGVWKLQDFQALAPTDVESNRRHSTWGTAPTQPASLLGHLLPQQQHEEEQQHGYTATGRQRLADAQVLLCGRGAPSPGLPASALASYCTSFGCSSHSSFATMRHVSFIRTLSVSAAHSRISLLHF